MRMSTNLSEAVAFLTAAGVRTLVSITFQVVS